MALKGRYIEADRDYVKYCLRYAVLVLGKRKVLAYIETLDDEGNRIETVPPGGSYPARKITDMRES